MKRRRAILVAAGLLAAAVGCGGQPAGGDAAGAPAASGTPAGERSVIGRWRDSRPVVESTIEIARVDGRLVLEQRFELDGSTLRYDLVEAGAEQGRRFDAAGDEAGGTYWVLTPAGDLQIYDSLGLVVTAQAE